MTSATLVPLAEYLQTSYHPDREWVEGELKERHVGEFSHSSVQRLFLRYFVFREEHLQLSAYPELRLQVTADNYRVPDVMVRRANSPRHRIVSTPPLLCIEILSPDDRMSDVQEKIADYLNMGVETVWIVDPRRRSALYVDSAGQRPVNELKMPGYEVCIPLAEVFAELDELEPPAGVPAR